MSHEVKSTQALARRRQIDFGALCLIVALITPTAARGDDVQTIKLPGDIALDQVDFRRHVLPLVSKLGCNAGNCHGSFQGRGGFRLSLFGHAPEVDFDAITDRIDTDNPAESLLVTKPMSKTDHGGGQRFLPDSWEHQLLTAWIRQGAKASAIDPAALPRLVASPRAIRLKTGDAAPAIDVSAKFGDEKEEPVTPLCRVESSDPGVVEIDGDGRVRALRPGMANLIVSYGGSFATVPVTIPFGDADKPPATGPAAPQADESAAPTDTTQAIDHWIGRRLAELNLASAAPADDVQFLRRVTLDVVGRLPSPDEIQQFLASDDPQKRAALIDRLLADPQHASLWATRLCDITGCRLETMEGPENLKRARAQMWHGWFRQRLQSSEPIDRLVRGVLCGTSRGDLSGEQFVEREIALVRAAEAGGAGEYAARPALDLYWRRVSNTGVYPREEMAERSAAAFLGIRIECARCHKHPNDRWTQADYAAFVNVFANVTFGSSIEVNRAVLARLDKIRSQRAAGAEPEAMPRLQELYDDPRQAQLMADARQKRLVPPRLLGGPDVQQNENGRDLLGAWLTQADNPYFARNWVNRVWAHYFGRGLVEPVDNFSSRNPPTHPELLDALAAEFTHSGFDMRALEREILRSRVYQQTSAPPAGATDAWRYYACTAVRPLFAEAMAQAVNQSLGATNAWGEDVPAGGSVWDIGASRPANARLAYLFELFGRGRREFVCDCNRSSDATLRQTLHLMADGEWIEQIRASALVADLTANESIPQALSTAYLRTLSRAPTPAEIEIFVPHVTAAADRKEAWVDVAWALLNSREFRTNH